MRADTNVPRILRQDGVETSVFDNANREVVSIREIIDRFESNTSWSHTVINSDSNSATLICQRPGEGNRCHFHPDWNEWWYIVEGSWEWEIEGTTKVVQKGDIVFIEKNKRHRVTAIGDKCAIRLAVSRYDVAHVYEEDQ